MKNFISVNAKYYKSSQISKISNHNSRESKIDYLLNEKDRKYDNKEIIYNSNSKNSSGGGINLDESNLGGIGTYSDNLKKLKSPKPNNSFNNSKLMQYQFYNLQQQKKEILQKKYKYKENDKENTLIDMVVSLSEEQAKHYLDNNIDLTQAYNDYMQQIKEKFGFEPLSLNLHVDEGYEDKNGEIHFNIHAHCVFYNFDFENEKSVLRNLKKQDWENMQNIAQDSFQKFNLDFKRGIPKNDSRKKHLERNEYILQQQNQDLKDVINDFEQKQNELKELYNLLNTQKNQLKTLKNDVDKNSNIYKVLSQNVKTLQQQEKEARQNYKEFSNLLNDKKSELKRVEEEIEDVDVWLKDTKNSLKEFLKEHTRKNSNNKFELNNVNEFYNELVSLSLHLTNYDLKIKEIEQLKATNFLLKNKIQEVNETKENNENNVNNLELKLKNTIHKKDILEDENYSLRKFIKNENLEDDYNRFLKNIDKENEIDNLEL